MKETYSLTTEGSRNLMRQSVKIGFHWALLAFLSKPFSASYIVLAYRPAYSATYAAFSYCKYGSTSYLEC
ncbi:unnamed protein product [Prunus armeniaca]|uniref:Uncharacterized protein n=1 Tax=Prunus armeniaca TaxID=36596 RepID=A0A6J5TF95_PRUAR|nr:unnamed protein product [Prunus armeniaca]CAB4292454.1 unnamed protein product [Prunus armeniaca]